MTSLRERTRAVEIRCEDCAEVVVFTRRDWKKFGTDYEITIEDSYCGGGYTGIAGRFRRAWHAFWAKPIYYSGVFIDDAGRAQAFFEQCIELIQAPALEVD